MAPQLAVRCGLADHLVRRLHPFSFAALLHCSALPRIWSCRLCWCAGQRMPTDHSVCRGVDRLEDACTTGLTIAEMGSGRPRDLWALFERFRPRTRDCHSDGRSHDPEMDATGATFWAVLTGIAFMLAGLAIVSGVLDVLAAWLLGLMLLVFSALTLAPMIFASPHNHEAWGANTYNLTAIGSTWIIAEWLAIQRGLVRGEQGSHQTKPMLA